MKSINKETVIGVAMLAGGVWLAFAGFKKVF